MGVRDLFELGGKVALVTGGSRGLGLQIAKGLAEMGARIAISARKARELADAKAEFAAQGVDAFTVAHDLAVADQVPALVEAVVGHYGRIDILVNNAGASWGAPAEKLPLEAWSMEMKAAPYYASKAAALQLTRALAAEWGPYGIRVNAICPGFFPSKLASGLLETIGPSVIAHTPLGRLGGDTDLQGAAVYLASDA